MEKKHALSRENLSLRASTYEANSHSEHRSRHSSADDKTGPSTLTRLGMALVIQLYFYYDSGGALHLRARYWHRGTTRGTCSSGLVPWSRPSVVTRVTLAPAPQTSSISPSLPLSPLLPDPPEVESQPQRWAVVVRLKLALRTWCAREARTRVCASAFPRQHTLDIRTLLSHECLRLQGLGGASPSLLTCCSGALTCSRLLLTCSPTCTAPRILQSSLITNQTLTTAQHSACD